MQFVDLSHCVTIRVNPALPEFATLRTMREVWLTQDLQLVSEPDNVANAKSRPSPDRCECNAPFAEQGE